MIEIKAIEIYQDMLNEKRIIITRLEQIDDTKDYLENESKKLNDNLEKLNIRIDCISYDLKQLSGVEYQIYYEVVVKGLNVTKAIDLVSARVNKDSSVLWKVYYPRVKEKIKKVSEIILSP